LDHLDLKARKSPQTPESWRQLNGNESVVVGMWLRPVKSINKIKTPLTQLTPSPPRNKRKPKTPFVPYCQDSHAAGLLQIGEHFWGHIYARRPLRIGYSIHYLTSLVASANLRATSHTRLRALDHYTSEPNIFLRICTHTHTITISSDLCPPKLFKLCPCIQKLCNVCYPPTPSLGWIGQIKSH
jgi:hypothetical protein